MTVRERPPSAARWGTLVFVHGRFGRGEIWSEVSDGLGTHFRSLQIDLPGFGDSFCSVERGISLVETSELLAHIMKALAGEPVILIGHDFGGAVAQHCALVNRPHVKGLILINSPCLVNTLREISSVASFLKHWGVRRRLMRLFSASPELSERHLRMLVEPLEDRQLRKSLFRTMDEIQRTWPGQIQRQAIREALSEFDLPVLLLWGARDTLVPPEEAFELIRTLPEAYFFQNERSGHWPCLEQTEWVIQKAREFLFRMKNQETSRVSFSGSR